MAKGRHEVRAAQKRWPLIVGLVAGVLVLALGGAAYATYRYEQANTGRMLAGTTIGGVNVSGMTRAEAIAAVRAHAREDLNREIVVVVRGERFTATARQLGQRPWVGQAVDQAMDAAERVGWVERAWRRFRNDPVDLDIELGMAGDRGVAGFVRRTARQVRVDPRNASIGMGEGGGLFFRHAKAGRELEVRRAERLLTEALDDGSATVRLSVRSVAAEVHRGHDAADGRRARRHEPSRPLRGVRRDAQLGCRHREAGMDHAGRRVVPVPEAREPDVVQPGARQLGRRRCPP